MASFGDLNRVNTNIQSLDAQLSLNRINSRMSKIQMQMSTGKRINSAEDDSAGYSIATKLRARVGGLNQALQNVGDAKSVLGMVESSYNTVMDNLVQMKSLATQASNDTLGKEERQFIGEQIKQLGEDINKVSDQTVYQNYDLLNGKASGETAGSTVAKTGNLSLTFQVGERAEDTIKADIGAINVGTLFASGGSTKTLGDTSNGAVTTGNSAIYADASTSGDVDGELHFKTSGGTAANSNDYRAFLDNIDSAITTMSKRVNKIGITQSSLSVRENTLSEAISANDSAKSRIMDTDFAKAQSESVRLQILQQTATAALAQANNGPQSVLRFVGR